MRRRLVRTLVVGVSLVGAPSGIAAGTESQRERGAYLVDGLAACAGCHTPRAPDGLGPALSGGNAFMGPRGRVFAPNITPDRATGIGDWSEDQIVAAIKRGVRPDGTTIGAPMPQRAYGLMSDADAKAIVAYLKSVAPVSHAVPRSERAAGPPRPGVEALSAGSLGERVAQGRYIAVALSHCAERHAAPSSPALAGGRAFRTADGMVVAPGITAGDLQRFSDSQLATLITKGIRPDGGKLVGPMPVRSYAAMRPEDLAALVAFLRSPQALGR